MNKHHDDPVLEYLHSVYGLSLEIRRCKDRIKMLEDQATNMTAKLSDMPRGGSADSGQLLAVLADELSLFNTRLVEVERARLEVENFISKIDNPTYRVILQYRYVDCLKWDDILERLRDNGFYYEKRWLFNLHGLALNAARELYASQEATARD